MSPQRWMRVERLRDAQRALSQTVGRPTTVTGVATRYGFYELGRFAATYRNTFGEAPSETLRGANRKSA
jgi:Transcriptional regulator containing an amidase domain and an AraC-type DNA-binding HTH domain